MDHADIDHSGLTGVGTGTLSDQGVITYLDATEAAAPATPASGKVRVYAKSDGRIYSKDDAGTEYGPFDAAGAGGSSSPLLYYDSIALDADGDEFDDDAVPGWTLRGALTSGDITAVTTEPYDATCLDVVLGAAGDGMYKAFTIGSTFEVSLTTHGQVAVGRMMGLAMTDGSGNGMCLAAYDGPAAFYVWGMSSHLYDGGSALATLLSGYGAGGAVKSSNWPITYRFKKSGTSITAGVSFDGGLTWAESTFTNTTTFTRVGVYGIYGGAGSSSSRLRIGRLNVA